MVVGSGFELVQKATIKVVASGGEWSDHTTAVEVRAQNSVYSRSFYLFSHSRGLISHSTLCSD